MHCACPPFCVIAALLLEIKMNATLQVEQLAKMSQVHWMGPLQEQQLEVTNHRGIGTQCHCESARLGLERCKSAPDSIS